MTMQANDALSWIAENDEHLTCRSIFRPLEHGIYGAAGETVLTAWPDTGEPVQALLVVEDHSPDQGTQYRCVPLVHGCVRQFAEISVERIGDYRADAPGQVTCRVLIDGETALVYGRETKLGPNRHAYELTSWAWGEDSCTDPDRPLSALDEEIAQAVIDELERN